MSAEEEEWGDEPQDQEGEWGDDGGPSHTSPPPHLATVPSTSPPSHTSPHPSPPPLHSHLTFYPISPPVPLLPLSDASGWGDDDVKAGDTGGWDDTSSSQMLTDEPEAPALTRQSSYRILDHDSLLQTQNRLVAQNAEVLFVSPSEAALLLRHYGWKAKKLQADWFESAKKVRDTVGITAAEEGKAGSGKAGQRVQCQSAYCDEVDVKDAHALSCGHYFCSDCWTAYLHSQINDGQKCVFTKCMGMRCTLDHAHKFGCSCNELVPEAVFQRFVTDARLLDKYQRWLLDSFVEGQRHIKWCPRPGCTFAASYASGGTKAIQCLCGYFFCFSWSVQRPTMLNSSSRHSTHHSLTPRCFLVCPRVAVARRRTLQRRVIW